MRSSTKAVTAETESAQRESPTRAFDTRSFGSNCESREYERNERFNTHLEVWQNEAIALSNCDRCFLDVGQLHKTLALCDRHVSCRYTRRLRQTVTNLPKERCADCGAVRSRFSQIARALDGQEFRARHLDERSRSRKIWNQICLDRGVVERDDEARIERGRSEVKREIGQSQSESGQFVRNDVFKRLSLMRERGQEQKRREIFYTGGGLTPSGALTKCARSFASSSCRGSKKYVKPSRPSSTFDSLRSV